MSGNILSVNATITEVFSTKEAGQVHRRLGRACPAFVFLSHFDFAFLSNDTNFPIGNGLRQGIQSKK